MKILIADDSSFMRKILVNTLKKEGHDFIHATNGEESVIKYKKEKPDLVLLDIIMEKRDGIEVLKDIIKMNPKVKDEVEIILADIYIE